jgi:hypothetical protein
MQNPAPAPSWNDGPHGYFQVPAMLQAGEAPALSLRDSTRVVSYNPSRPLRYDVVNRVFGAVVDPGVIRPA